MSAPKRKRNLPTLPLRVVIAGFTVYFLLYSRPWKVATATRTRRTREGAMSTVPSGLSRRRSRVRAPSAPPK